MEIQPLSSSVQPNYAPSSQQASTPSANTQSAHQPAETVNATEHVTKEAVKATSTAQNAEEIKQSVEKINKTIQGLARNLQFTVDSDTKMNVVKVVDTDTKEVIRQFPSEEALAIAKALDKLQGLLFTDKA